MSISAQEHYTAAGGVLVDAGRVLVLLRRSRGEIRLPKGHVEPGESPEQAALRETCEESGYCDFIVLADLGAQQVTFEYQGRRIVRDEHYFLLGLQSSSQVVPPEAQFESIWLAWPAAEHVLTFEAEREWVRRARHASRSSEHCHGPRVILSTGSLYTYGLSRAFDLASTIGYDGVEILVDHRWDTRQAEYLRSLTDTHGVRVVSLHSPFVREVPGWPSDELGRLEHTVGLAQALDVGIVVAHLPIAFHHFSVEWHGSGRHRSSLVFPRLRKSAYERFLLDGLADFERREGVCVCVENMPVHHVAAMPINAFRHNTMAGLSAFPHLTLDTTHLASWGLDPLRAYSEHRGRIAHVHISNYKRASGQGHRPPNDGDLDLAALLRRLQMDRFAGYVVLEGNPTTLQASDPVACQRLLQLSLEFCRAGLSDSSSDS